MCAGRERHELDYYGNEKKTLPWVPKTLPEERDDADPGGAEKPTPHQIKPMSGLVFW